MKIPWDEHHVVKLRPFGTDGCPAGFVIVTIVTVSWVSDFAYLRDVFTTYLYRGEIIH